MNSVEEEGEGKRRGEGATAIREPVGNMCEERREDREDVRTGEGRQGKRAKRGRRPGNTCEGRGDHYSNI